MKIKKLSICLALCLILIPGLLVFNACKKDEGYSLNNLYDDYMFIVQQNENISLNENNELIINYNQFSYQNVSYFTNALTSAPYNNLTTFYNPILNNTLAFVSGYIEKCSSDRLDVPKETRNQLKSTIDEFDIALKNMYTHTLNVADLLKTGGDIETNVHMIRLSSLFASYEELYLKSYNLSHELANIYFNYAISDANPNYSLLSLEQFDASRVVVNLRSRIVNQISKMTFNFIEQNVKGLNLYNALTTKQNGSYQAVPSSFSSYQSDVNSIDQTFSSSLGQYINTSNKKEKFYNASIELFNVQACLNNLESVYYTACNDITYALIKTDSNATDYQKTCLKVIEDYTELVNQNTLALQNILAILTETT